MFYPKESFVILKGSTPPPIGGVSIHVSRLSNVLTKSGVEHRIWDTSIGTVSYYTNLFKILFSRFPKNTILHLHSIYWKHLLVVLLISYLKPFKIYLTNHNIWAIDKKFKLISFLLRKLQPRLSKLLYVNPGTPEKYKEANIEISKFNERISPFLPPNLDEKDEIFNAYSDKIKRFLAEKSPILIANAHKIVFLNDVDLYGFDMCTAALPSLLSRFPDLGLIFAIGDVTDHNDYIMKKMEEMEKSSISDSFLLVYPQITIWPLIAESDVMLRPTSTDGSAISIDEALYLGTKVLASDATARQKGTAIFKNRDQSDFIKKIIKILDNATVGN
ncbi:MAG: glycosyltransferase [Bacteroidota bacterium]